MVRFGMARVCAIIAMLTFGACNKQDNTAERDFVAKEVVELKAALAARDESKVLVGCITTTTGLERMPKTMVDEIERLCYVDAPRLLLDNAVRDAREAKAKYPDDVAGISCAQLLAGDAFATIKAHPMNDPALNKLVDEYTRLCPEQVAKFRAR
jgi:hypothetical protein